MASMEDLELLRAAMAVALADGNLRRSEMGVIKGLAARTGVGRVSFDAMLGAAESDPSFADKILIHSPDKARLAVEILVAEAGLDGEISPRERVVIQRIARQLNITDQELGELYEAGLRRADALRKHHVAPKRSGGPDRGSPGGSPHP